MTVTWRPFSTPMPIASQTELSGQETSDSTLLVVAAGVGVVNRVGSPPVADAIADASPISTTVAHAAIAAVHSRL